MSKGSEKENQNYKIHQMDVLRMTSHIVSSYVSNNVMQASEVPPLLESIYMSLKQLTEPQHDTTINDSYLICLEDGKKLKTLKRHLMSAYGLTPEAYKKRWGLPSDYPMVAPEYTRRRAEIAKRRSFGSHKRLRKGKDDKTR